MAKMAPPVSHYRPNSLAAGAWSYAASVGCQVAQGIALAALAVIIDMRWRRESVSRRFQVVVNARHRDRHAGSHGMMTAMKLVATERRFQRLLARHDDA